jgi:hypothetical protein
MKKLLVSIALGTVALFATSSLSFAAERLIVEVDQSTVMALPSAPGAIIVGNPAIADISINGQQIFIHGRGYGETNLTILDLQGKQMANFIVQGTHSVQSSAIIYKGGARYTYSCAPFCEVAPQIGDEKEHFGVVTSQASAKFKLATGNGSAEAQGATPAPQ